MSDKDFCNLIFCGAMLFVILFFAIAAPDERSINSCMDSTGWSKARCEIELSR